MLYQNIVNKAETNLVWMTKNAETKHMFLLGCSVGHEGTKCVVVYVCPLYICVENTATLADPLFCGRRLILLSVAGCWSSILLQEAEPLFCCRRLILLSVAGGWSSILLQEADPLFCCRRLNLLSVVGGWSSILLQEVDPLVCCRRLILYFVAGGWTSCLLQEADPLFCYRRLMSAKTRKKFGRPGGFLTGSSLLC